MPQAEAEKSVASVWGDMVHWASSRIDNFICENQENAKRIEGCLAKPRASSLLFDAYKVDPRVKHVSVWYRHVAQITRVSLHCAYLCFPNMFMSDLSKEIWVCGAFCWLRSNAVCVGVWVFRVLYILQHETWNIGGEFTLYQTYNHCSTYRTKDFCGHAYMTRLFTCVLFSCSISWCVW